jgi:hypothetical protein
VASHLIAARSVPAALIVALVAASPAPAATPSGALTLRFDVDPRAESSHTVRFLAVGDAPDDDVKLVDSEGQHVVTATKSSDAKACDSAGSDERDTGLGESSWCVTLKGVRAGESVSGKLAGADATVKLTVTARHALLWPAIAAFVAALAAGILVWATTYGLSSLVAGLRRKAAVNRHKGEIQGLEEWDDDATDRLTEAQRLERILWMHQRGVPHLKRMRAALKKEVEAAAREMPENELLRAARHEAGRTDVKVTDLVGPDDEVAVSDAEQLLELVRTARAGLKDFDAQVDLLMPQIPDTSKGDAEALVAQARASLSTLSPLRVGRVLDGLQEVIDQLIGYAAPDRTAAFAVMGMSGPRAAAARASAVLRSPRVAGFVDAAQAGVAVVVLVAALMALVVATALSANWAPKQTFASFWDYAALVVSVFGSATITGIVSAAVLLRSTQARRPGA